MERDRSNVAYCCTATHVAGRRRQRNRRWRCPSGPRAAGRETWVTKVVKTLCDQELHLGLRVRGQQGLAARSPVGAHPMTAGTTVLVRAARRRCGIALSISRRPRAPCGPGRISRAVVRGAAGCSRRLCSQCSTRACPLRGSDPVRPACVLTLLLYHAVAAGGALFQLVRDLMSACRGCRKARASCSKRAAYSTAAARIRAQTSPLHGVPARPTSVSRPRFDAASLDRLRATAPGYIYA